MNQPTDNSIKNNYVLKKRKYREEIKKFNETSSIKICNECRIPITNQTCFYNKNGSVSKNCRNCAIRRILNKLSNKKFGGRLRAIDYKNFLYFIENVNGMYLV